MLVIIIIVLSRSYSELPSLSPRGSESSRLRGIFITFLSPRLAHGDPAPPLSVSGWSGARGLLRGRCRPRLRLRATSLGRVVVASPRFFILAFGPPLLLLLRFTPIPSRGNFLISPSPSYFFLFPPRRCCRARAPPHPYQYQGGRARESFSAQPGCRFRGC